MARLDLIGFNELAPTLRILADADVTTEDFAWLRTPGNAPKLQAFLQEARGLTLADDAYKARFAAAIRACACDYNSPELTTEFFGEDVFGTLGEGYSLGQPSKTEAAEERGYWNEEEIDAWHASADVVGKGLEAAYLVDLAKYGQTNSEEQRTKAIVCWRAGKNARVAYLRRDDSERGFCVGRRDGDWRFGCWFLLRKVHQP